MTNWYAQAEHGGFYQAVATGLYKKDGLDVTIKMGGPQVNIMQLLAAGQADCYHGLRRADDARRARAASPAVTVAAAFQKDPQVLIAHPSDVNKLEDLKGKTILISAAANTTYWPWLKAKYGSSDSQMRPYTFNIQPFVADKNIGAAGLPVHRAVRDREGSRRSSPTCSCSPTTAGRRTPPPSCAWRRR